MKEICWNSDKNIELKKERNVSFEELLGSRFIGIEGHPRLKHQKVMLFEHNNYVWVVSYVIKKE